MSDRSSLFINMYTIRGMKFEENAIMNPYKYYLTFVIELNYVITILY